MRLPVHIWLREENATPEELAGYFTELARRLDAHPQKMRLMIESSVPAVLDFDPADGEPVVSVGGRTQKFSLRHRWLPEHPVPLLLGPVPISAAASSGSVPNEDSGPFPISAAASAGSVPVSSTSFAGSVPIGDSGSVPTSAAASSGSVPIEAAGSVPIGDSGSVPTSAAASSGSVPNVRERISEFFGRFLKKKCVVLLIDPIEGNRFRVRSRRVVRVPRSLYALFAVMAVAAVITFHPLALTLSAVLLIALIVMSLQS